ncbi:germination protein, Ger(x)C family [Clostridium cavendishii DSM 21758]|uniref:Germination protein, Ger(X)C family n=1 Tax=Clostridium cavendishii DSM 21758 TaxID=1121302 RepID=A0A1M6Q512_9CLOT|nr:Ger(x)C family spore germination protein [Clostridium cavendishii]SHK15240.1 germination protein, Ger(x)C family [Clostridium cavendishii DSM 21758]
MRKIKSLIAVLLVFIMSIGFVGCYNYNDINKITFATTTIFDEDEFGNVVIYIEGVKPYRNANESSDKGRRLIYKGTGKTVLEAIKNVNMASSYKINFTQCRAYIFTEKVAKTGIKKFVDILSRDQEFMQKPYLFVLFDEVENLLKTAEGDEEYLGLYLEDLSLKMKTSPKAVTVTINEYLNNRTSVEKIGLLGALELKEDVGKKRLMLKGGAILKDDIMVYRITENEVFSYNFLNNKVKSATLELSNPLNQNSFITLEILNAKTTTSLTYDNGKYKLNKGLKLNCALSESQDNLILTNENLNYIKAVEAEAIKEKLTTIFKDFKEKNLDIFNINRLFEMRYSENKNDNSIFKNTDLNLDVEVNIKDVSNVKNTY